MTHLTFEQLVDYVEGRLNPAELAEVQAHLSTGCATCQAELAWLEQTLGAMAADTWEAPTAAASEAARQLFPVPTTIDPLPIWRRVPVAVGATAVLIAALLLLVWLYFNRPAPIEPEPTHTPTPTAPAVEDEAAAMPVPPGHASAAWHPTPPSLQATATATLAAQDAKPPPAARRQPLRPRHDPPKRWRQRPYRPPAQQPPLPNRRRPPAAHPTTR
jgi:hypothetical protein